MSPRKMFCVFPYVRIIPKRIDLKKRFLDWYSDVKEKGEKKRRNKIITATQMQMLLSSAHFL